MKLYVSFYQRAPRRSLGTTTFFLALNLQVGSRGPCPLGELVVFEKYSGKSFRGECGCSPGYNQGLILLILCFAITDVATARTFTTTNHLNLKIKMFFFFIFVFSIQLTVNKCLINFADNWIRTADFWYRN